MLVRVPAPAAPTEVKSVGSAGGFLGVISPFLQLILVINRRARAKLSRVRMAVHPDFGFVEHLGRGTFASRAVHTQGNRKLSPSASAELQLTAGDKFSNPDAGGNLQQKGPWSGSKGLKLGTGAGFEPATFRLYEPDSDQSTSDRNFGGIDLRAGTIGIGTGSIGLVARHAIVTIDPVIFPRVRACEPCRSHPVLRECHRAS